MEIRLKPGEKLSEEILTKLQEVNKTAKNKNFSEYLKNIKEIFPVKVPQISTETNFFLAGFLEGEASLNISAKKLETAAFGLVIDPEFSITQHVNGFSMLYLALLTFKAGRIRYKSGSNATLVFIIDNRETLEEKVIPFYQSYVVPYGSGEKVQRLYHFKRLLELFQAKDHLNFTSFQNKILPIWDQMRKQKGQSNESFASLEDAKKYMQEFMSTKSIRFSIGSSETTRHPI